MTDEQEQSQGHPAWQEILSQLPEDLHSLVKPKLEEWDKRSQDMVQGVHSQYDPYKKFVENKVDPAILEQSLFMANALQNDPEAFVRRVIENYGIESFNQVQQQEEEHEVPEWDGEDISAHPQFKALADQFKSINDRLEKQDQESQAQREQREFDEYMEGLKEKNKDNGEFNELFVSALMANGLDGDEAVKQYYDMVGSAVAAATGGQQQQQQTPAPPVVLGGSGNAGSGTPDAQVNMGGLKDGQVQDLVIEMLKAQGLANNS